MASRSDSRRAALNAWIGETHPERVTEEDLRNLLEALAPVSESYLRKLLRESGLALSPLVEGVRQETLDELERSLAALQAEYGAAVEAGDRRRAKACRRLVISAKDHARWSAARAKSPEQRRHKDEMAEWMLVWLENPSLFDQWAKLRRQAPPNRA